MMSRGQKWLLLVLLIILPVGGWLAWPAEKSVPTIINNNEGERGNNVVWPPLSPLNCQDLASQQSISCIRTAQIADPQLKRGELLYQRPTYQAYRAQYQSEGLTIYGLLTIPNEASDRQPAPAVVFLHGYIPPPQYRTTQRYEDYVDYLARQGFVVFKIDYRGHDQSQGEATGAYFTRDYVMDARAAVAALASLPEVDDQQINLWGHSMSGNVALRTALTEPRVHRVVIWAGAVFTYYDFLEYGLSDHSYQPPKQDEVNEPTRRRQVREALGALNPDNPHIKQMSPAHFLSELTVPIQLHHAINDDVVNIEYARNLRNLLQAQQKEVELWEYDTGGHNLSDPAFNAAMTRTVEFYRRAD